MKPNSTGIAARMMLSIDRARISEALLNNRQLQSTPCRSVIRRASEKHSE